MRNLTLSFFLLLFTTLATADQIYTFKCGECGRVEQFTTSGSHYCYGTKEKPHTKRLMDRVSSSTSLHHFKCGECGRVESSTNTDSHYCYGTPDHRHAKRLMDRID